MKVKFAVIKDESFDCSLLETKLLKTFKEVDCEADIVKVEDEIFENNDVQTHLSEITIHVTGKISDIGSFSQYIYCSREFINTAISYSY